ncbi:hypothetical protein ACTHQF_02190 [Pedobacter sp. SAFR-022]|uniref:hypothetical protein n=1 Tax=Pedobacter sp. SAFR-022 TaxID=3436861 RepID=UPI003F7F7966
MKSFYLKALWAAALAVTLSACEKKAENFEKSSEQVAAATSELVYPVPSTELPDNILPERKLPRAVLTKGYMYKNIKVKLIDTVCAEYIQGTKKLGFSNLTERVFYNRFGSAELKFIVDHEFNNRGFARLTPGANGWWTHWNYSPYTESEYPEVLFARNRWGGEVRGENGITLLLNKRVTTFGFEIAPNVTGKDFRVSVTYPSGSTYRAPTLFSVSQTISSPSGARLIAVKSEVPFDYVMIDVEGMTFREAGFAIANIRYALAE